jgi:hypothetical protein
MTMGRGQTRAQAQDSDKKIPVWHFVAPEGAAAVCRNGVYPVEQGVFAVDDHEDAEAFREQGYPETAAPVASTTDSTTGGSGDGTGAGQGNAGGEPPKDPPTGE